MRIERTLGVFLSLIALAGCGPRKFDGDALKRTADSATEQAWAPQRTSPTHSPYYDSLLAYYKRAVTLEQSKLTWLDSLAKLGIVDPKALLADSTRQRDHQTIARALDESLEWDERVDSLRALCDSYLRACVDTALKEIDPAQRAQLHSYVLRIDRFEPNWQRAYDAFESDVLGTYEAIVAVFDSARRNVVFDSVLRFQDKTLASEFNSLLVKLDSLSEKEKRIIERKE